MFFSSPALFEYTTTLAERSMWTMRERAADAAEACCVRFVHSFVHNLPGHQWNAHRYHTIVIPTKYSAQYIMVEHVFKPRDHNVIEPQRNTRNITVCRRLLGRVLTDCYCRRWTFELVIAPVYTTSLYRVACLHGVSACVNLIYIRSTVCGYRVTVCSYRVTTVNTVCKLRLASVAIWPRDE